MNVLLTSVGRRTYMIEYFKNALRGKGRVFASNSMTTYSLQQADEYTITPPIHEEGYVDFLLAYCREKSIDVVISLFDVDLPVLAKNIQRFDDIGVKVVVSSEEAVSICNDKWKTYQFLLSIGFEQPKTYVSIEDCKKGLHGKEVEFPLIIKPRWGMGSIGIFEAETEEELDVLYKKLHRVIFGSYLRFESTHNSDACIVIQEKIVGDEYGLDILNDLNGNYVAMVAKRKLAIRAGETDIARTVDNAIFQKTSETLAESLQHVGNLDVDCFLASDGKIYVLEMNARFGGQYPFSHLSGVDFPAQIVKWCNNERTDTALLRYKTDLLMAKDLFPVIVSPEI